MDISYFNIIYEAIDFVEKSIKGTLEPETKEEIIGQCTKYWKSLMFQKQVK